MSTIFILPVEKGWLALETSTLASGYSCPSSQTIVSEVAMVDRVSQETPAEVSWKTTRAVVEVDVLRHVDAK